MGGWHHARWFDPHEPQPDLDRQYVQGGTGAVEAPCQACDEVVIRDA